LANSIALALPIPEPAPVMTTTRFLSRMVSFSPLGEVSISN
jgi:hypothetical protein